MLTGRELLVRKLPAYPRCDLTAPAEFGRSFSPDGTRLAVLEAGGSVLVFDLTVPRERRPLAAGEPERLWADLGSDDPRTGWAAVYRLCDHPGRGGSAPGPPSHPGRGPGRSGRSGAGPELPDLPDPRDGRPPPAGCSLSAKPARPAVAAALKAGPATEARERLERLAASQVDDRPPQATDLQRLRALVVLERVRTAEARALALARSPAGWRTPARHGRRSGRPSGWPTTPGTGREIIPTPLSPV